MTVSGLPEPPAPRDPKRLSSHEEAVLARIESDLVGDDPDLARLATSRPPLLPMRSPVSARALAALVAILLVLVGTAIALPAAALWTVLPVLTVVLVAPWTVLCARRAAADR